MDDIADTTVTTLLDISAYNTPSIFPYNGIVELVELREHDCCKIM